MGIHLELSRFDGRSKAVLEEIAVGFPPDEETMGHLVSISADPDGAMQSGATWLLRRHLDAGATLTREQTARLIDTLPDVSDGFARLHLCQLMGRLELDDESAARAVTFVERCLESDHTFVRAWAPDAYWRIAREHDVYRPAARSAVEAALSDPKASVRARARKILEER